MRRPAIDPELHLFCDDAELHARHNLWRVTQTFRREQSDPVLVCDRPWEGSAIGTLSVLTDPQTGRYHMWYLVVKARPICLATSADGVTWTKPDLDVAQHDAKPTNIVHTREHGAVFSVEHGLAATGSPQGGRRDGEWGADAQLVACEYLGIDYPRPDGEARERGIYVLSSSDGVHWVRRPEPVLPLQGDRTTLYFDEQRQLFLLFSRHDNLSVEKRAGVEGLKRDIALWESSDLVNWDYQGVVLRPDEFDDTDTEFYGMSVFRYGGGFVGLLLIYHLGMEKLDVELAWSSDGRSWQRVGRRSPCFSYGGEGTWDSHWVQAAHTPPQIDGDRMKIWYNGGNTKHGSGDAHRKSVGLASLRLDAFVSLEAGREEGSLVTTELPSDGPRTLEVNASFPTGWLAAELLNRDGTVIDGYGAADCAVDGTDGTRMPVRWKGKSSVQLPPGGVKLRLRLYQASLFSYRWADAGGSDGRAAPAA